MLILYILIGIACFIAICTLFNRYYIIFLPRKRQELYLVVEGDIPHMEAALRELYGFLQRKAWFEPVIVDKSLGDGSLIVEKFCQSYTLPRRKSLPEKYVKTLYIDRYSNIKSLKREIALLRTEIEVRDRREHKNA